MRQFACLLMFLASFAAAAAQEVRTWTDSQGRQMQAQFVRELDGDVTFIKDGKLITFPLEKLSEADQKLIREAETDKKVEEAARPAGAPAKDVGSYGLLPPADSFSSTESKSNLTKQRMVAEERTWRDLRGQQTVGKFVRMHNGNVVLQRGGRVVTISFYSLSRTDREYVRELLAARGESAQLPLGMPEDPSPGVEAPTPSERASNAGANVEASSREVPRPETGPVASSEPTGAAEGRVASRALPIPSLPNPNHASEMAEKLRSQVSEAAVQPKREVNWARVFIGAPIGAMIGSLIGAFILRAAAHWVLGYDVAYGDAFVAMFVASLLNFGLGLGVGFAYGAISGSGEGSAYLSFILLPLAFFVQSGVISNKLDTDFGSACKVTLAMYAIYFVIAIVIVGVAIAVLRPAS